MTAPPDFRGVAEQLDAMPRQRMGVGGQIVGLEGNTRRRDQIRIALDAAYAAGAAAERAECANIVSEYAREAADAFTDGKGTFFAKMREFCNDIAHAIRARSATTKPEGK